MAAGFWLAALPGQSGRLAAPRLSWGLHSGAGSEQQLGKLGAGPAGWVFFSGFRSVKLNLSLAWLLWCCWLGIKLCSSARWAWKGKEGKSKREGSRAGDAHAGNPKNRRVRLN